MVVAAVVLVVLAVVLVAIGHLFLVNHLVAVRQLSLRLMLV